MSDQNNGDSVLACCRYPDHAEEYGEQERKALYESSGCCGRPGAALLVPRVSVWFEYGPASVKGRGLLLHRSGEFCSHEQHGKRGMQPDQNDVWTSRPSLSFGGWTRMAMKSSTGTACGPDRIPRSICQTSRWGPDQQCSRSRTGRPCPVRFTIRLTIDCKKNDFPSFSGVLDQYVCTRYPVDLSIALEHQPHAGPVGVRWFHRC
jgi:hypothetical protein